MHLSSITIKGFKSFPERTKLVFSPGVSVSFASCANADEKVLPSLPTISTVSDTPETSDAPLLITEPEKE